MKTNPKDYNPEYLRNTRLKRGLTEKELAERVGVNVSTIAGYESGNFRPSVRRWKMLKDALEIADTEPDERELRQGAATQSRTQDGVTKSVI